MVISASSSLDGLVWTCDNTNGWQVGDGVYEVPLIIPCTPGSVITFTIDIQTVDLDVVPVSITVNALFADWS